eukprot:snap_masked-scaffold_13-processed-gene-11.22-mRNA-1 protein AED:1.00 eAED:1.00 QI:0/-1/0/0/-1/1/1/0/573
MPRGRRKAINSPKTKKTIKKPLKKSNFDFELTQEIIEQEKDVIEPDDFSDSDKENKKLKSKKPLLRQEAWTKTPQRRTRRSKAILNTPKPQINKNDSEIAQVSEILGEVTPDTRKKILTSDTQRFTKQTLLSLCEVFGLATVGNKKILHHRLIEAVKDASAPKLEPKEVQAKNHVAKSHSNKEAAKEEILSRKKDSSNKGESLGTISSPSKKDLGLNRFMRSHGSNEKPEKVPKKRGRKPKVLSPQEKIKTLPKKKDKKLEEDDDNNTPQVKKQKRRGRRKATTKALEIIGQVAEDERGLSLFPKKAVASPKKEKKKSPRKIRKKSVKTPEPVSMPLENPPTLILPTIEVTAPESPKVSGMQRLSLIAEAASSKVKNAVNPIVRRVSNATEKLSAKNLFSSFENLNSPVFLKELPSRLSFVPLLKQAEKKRKFPDSMTDEIPKKKVKFNQEDLNLQDIPSAIIEERKARGFYLSHSEELSAARKKLQVYNGKRKKVKFGETVSDTSSRSYSKTPVAKKTVSSVNVSPNVETDPGQKELVERIKRKIGLMNAEERVIAEKLLEQRLDYLLSTVR